MKGFVVSVVAALALFGAVAADVKCPAVDPEDPYHPVHLPHPSDCTKFYKCLAGVAHLLDCPAGLHWNAEKDYCDYPSEAQCQKQEVDEPESSKPVQPEQEPPVSCPAEDPIDPTHPIHIGHPTNCSLFYKCLKGVPYLHQCPPGLHWNAKKDYCDYPAEAGCEKKVSEIPEVPKPDVEPEVPVDVPKCPAVDPEDPDSPAHIPHPTDCTRFYKCLQGVAYIQDCPDGLHWNVQANYCDYPEVAGCQK